MANNSDLYQPIGPARLWYGDPTAGSGAMKDLGPTENVVFNPGYRMTFGSDAELNGAPDSDKLFDECPIPTISADLTDFGVTNLNNITHSSTITGDTLGGGSAFTKHSAKRTLFMLPKREESDGVTAANGVWIPTATVQFDGGPNHGRSTINGETIVTFPVTFTGAYTVEDQTSGTPVAIPANARMFFIGDPSNLSLTWTIA